MGDAAVFQHGCSTPRRSWSRWQAHAAGFSCTLCSCFKICYILETPHGCSAQQAAAAEAEVQSGMIDSAKSFRKVVKYLMTIAKLHDSAVSESCE